MTIFEFTDYKIFVNQSIASLPGKGRGEFQRISQALSVHPTLVSHIFRAQKDLTLEQAASLAKYFKFSTMELDYFLLLVTFARAGSKDLKATLERQIETFRKRSRDLIHRVPTDATLNDHDKAIFYSNWYYSAIRLSTSIPELNTREAIQKYFKLPATIVDRVLEFLTTKGLCRFDGKHYSLGPAITHLEASSEFISKHHLNWRLKAIERHSSIADRDLIFSAPLTLAKKDADSFREKLVELIKELGESAKNSSPEELRCINIDWLEIRS